VKAAAGHRVALKDEEHTPFLARVRRFGHSPTAFRHRGIFPWAAAGIAFLSLLILLPYIEPRATPFTQRLATLSALVFLFAAPALWMGLGRRAFAIATPIVLGIYGVTGWTGAFFGGDDLLVVAVILGFAIFGLSGFNLVFVLEEMVYDAHRLLPKRFKTKAWLAVPTLALVALTFGLPRFGLEDSLRATWVASIACFALMVGWWIFSAFNDLDIGPTILRELHLFVASLLLIAALADSIPVLVAAEALIPGLIAYLALIGTWVYVSYTTLQRTHFLLRGRNAAPWIAILLAATYAIVAQAQALSAAANETQIVQELFQVRMEYMVAGVALGIGFYVGRSVWRGLRLISRSKDFERLPAEAAAVAQGMLGPERGVGHATFGLYRALDGALPGSRLKARGWELDEETQRVRRLD
jgi:hypothetical protein